MKALTYAGLLAIFIICNSANLFYTKAYGGFNENVNGKEKFQARDTTDGIASDSNKVDVRTIENFNAKFKNATKVCWTFQKNCVKVCFIIKEDFREAFYDFNSEIIASGKKVQLDSLPVYAKRTFAKRYHDYTVKEVIRFEGWDETGYFISAENEKESVIFKVPYGGDLYVYKRVRKNIFW